MTKQLLSGTALLALLALSMPAVAQAPAIPASPGTAAPSPAAPSSSAPAAQPMQAAPGSHQHPAAAPQSSTSAGMAPSSTAAGQMDQGMQRRHKMDGMRGAGRRHGETATHHGMQRRGKAHRGGQPSDNVANQLNAQEAQRLSGGGLPTQGGMPMHSMHGGMQMQPAPAQSPAPAGAAPSAAPMR